MRLALTLILLLGVSAGGYYVWSKAPAREAEHPTTDRQLTAVCETRDIHFAVNAAGDIGPADQVSVRPEVNGRIAELPVDIGDKVARGALLCRLDDRDLQIERSQRLAEIDGAKLQVQKAERAFKRNHELFTGKLIAAEIYDDSRTEFQMATNSLARAEAALRLVEDRLSKTRILAPFDCTVLTRAVSIGQAVSGSGGFNSGTEVMTIANLKDMIVNAHINQADVIRLTPGQDLEVQVESVPGLRMKGKLDRIAPQAVMKNGIKGFAARVAIQDIDPRVRPGMTAILSIPVASAEGVLAVPLAAVFTEKGERYVFVKAGADYVRRDVVVGITDYNFAEVRAGLEEGEIVSLEQIAAAESDKPGAVPPAGRNRLSAGTVSPTNLTATPGSGGPRNGAAPERPAPRLPSS